MICELPFHSRKLIFFEQLGVFVSVKPQDGLPKIVEHDDRPLDKRRFLHAQGTCTFSVHYLRLRLFVQLAPRRTFLLSVWNSDRLRVCR